MLKKKGVIEVGFSWIFILLAGVAILSLFSYIGVKQGTFFTDKLHGRLLIDLSSIFIGSQVSRNTAAIISIPSSDIRFDCDGFKTGRVNYPFNGFAVFAPERIKTDKLITWSRGWGIGFRVMNFLYITAPNVKYYILYNNQSPNNKALATKLFEEFPDVKVEEYAKNKEIGCLYNSKCTIGYTKIKDEGYARINILVVGYMPARLPLQTYTENDFKDYASSEVTIIYVNNTAELNDDIFAADITFKDKNQLSLVMDPYAPQPIYTQRIIDKSSVFGAFISGSPHIFQCMMKTAYLHAKPVAEIYYRRTKNLGINSRALCRNFYDTQGLAAISNIKTELNDGSASAESLTTNQLALAQLNNQLERTSCPQLY